MAIFKTEGFDTADTVQDLLDRGWKYAEGTINATGSKWGGRCLDFGSSSASTLIGLDFPTSVTVNAYISVSFWMYQATQTTTENVILTIGERAISGSSLNIGYTHLSLIRKVNGDISVNAANGSTQATITSGLAIGVWQHFELRSHLLNSTGTLELWLDGVLVADLVCDTRDSGTIVSMQIVAASSQSTMVDDIVLQRGNSEQVHTGVVKIDTLVPTGNGTNTAWTGTVTDIDDGFGAHDGDTTYVTSSTVSQKQDYAFSDLSDTPTSIFSVGLNTVMRKDDSNARAITPYILSNSVTESGIQISASEAYINTDAYFDVNPDGDVAWTATTVNALLAGHELTV
jgi:hypothetical protein